MMSLLAKRQSYYQKCKREIMNWSRYYDKCTHCCTEEWKHIGKGFCKKCYPLMKKLEIIEKWDTSNISSLKVVKPINIKAITLLIKSNKIENAKESLLKQIRSQLHLYKIYNSDDTVDGIKIENLFYSISRITNNLSTSNVFREAANRYNYNFNNDQRRIICKDLLMILINRRFYLNIWQDV